MLAICETCCTVDLLHHCTWIISTGLDSSNAVKLHHMHDPSNQSFFSIRHREWQKQRFTGLL